MHYRTTILGTAALALVIAAGCDDEEDGVLTAPIKDAVVPTTGLVVSWQPVTQTINGAKSRPPIRSASAG